MISGGAGGLTCAAPASIALSTIVIAASTVRYGRGGAAPATAPTG
jgi:hypothetical protein